jgi:peptidyl-prolyl cis-trans isomerase D
MRKRVRAIMIIVAAAFILGFLGSELWNIIARRGGARRDPTVDTKGLVGEVGKHGVTPEEYRAALSYITDKYKTDNRLRDLTNEDHANIEQQTWRFLVTELTWSKVLEDARIRITQDEVLQIMQANPPEELRNRPELMTDGKFDQQKYIELMNKPENREYFAKYYQELIEMLPKEKFRIDVISAWRPTQLELQEVLRGANSNWKVTSLYFGPAAVADAGNVEPTDAEIKAYYESHQDDFKVKEVRQIGYAVFPVMISNQDSADARELIDKAYAQLQSGETFNLTMLDFSELAPETLPGRFPRSRLDPATDSAVKKIKVGEYSQPFLTSYGWQIVLLDTTGTDSVALRRIVVRVKQGTEALGLVQDSVRSFIDAAAETPFETLAAQRNIPVLRARPMVGGEANLAGINIDSPSQVEQWAKHAKAGSVLSTPQRGPYGYYVFYLASVTPAGVQEFEKVKPAAGWRVRQEKEKALWLAKAQAAVEQLRAGKTFEQYAAENAGVELQSEDFAGVVDARRRKGAEFAGALVDLNQGERVGPIAADWGAFVIRCDERTETQATTADAYVQQRQQELAQQLLNEYLKTPEIKDYRNTGQY